MYGIYANIGGILMVNVTISIAYMDPMGYKIPNVFSFFLNSQTSENSSPWPSC